jgi:hypothetical protein
MDMVLGSIAAVKLLKAKVTSTVFNDSNRGQLNSVPG